MKNIFLILLIFTSILNAQYSPYTEYKYLKLINFQKNSDLINDNLTNAEYAAKVFLTELESNYKSCFYNELSKVYVFKEKYNKAYYYQLLRIALFKDSTCFSEHEYNNFAEICGIPRAEAIHNLMELNSFSDSTPIKDKLDLLSRLAINIGSDEIKNEIKNLAEIYKVNDILIPTWLIQWNFLTDIGFRSKKIKEIINFNIAGDIPIYQVASESIRKKILSKAINYYLNNNSYYYADFFIAEYSKQDLNFLQNTDLIIKKIRRKCRI